MSAKQWRSCAEWEPVHGFLNNITTDDHYTEDAAKAVCKILDKEGLGGNGNDFPVRTWTEAIEGGAE